jgi:glucose-1-phosphate cytidylyltransferase
MVCESKVFDYIKDDSVSFEKEPLSLIAKEGELVCYRHDSFWQCMDTLRDKNNLESLYNSGKAPWKVW